MNIRILLLILLFITCLVIQSMPRKPQTFYININEPAEYRYSHLASAKAQSITNFIKYLYTHTTKYYIAFNLVYWMSPFLPFIMDNQFYGQCKSIADTISHPVSDIIVFNYMYQLGAYRDFCTAISIQSDYQQSPSNQAEQRSFFLGRNLDYGYQEYLSNNSVILIFYEGSTQLNSQKNKQQFQTKVVFKTIGHAGLIGAHTGIRVNQANSSQNYAVSLNQRVHGGLHVTLWHIFTGRGHTAPYLLRNTLYQMDNAQKAIMKLSASQTYAPVYYIINAKNNNILIEKDRNGSHAVFQKKGPKSFLIQTNTDMQLPDPDTRRDTAQKKVSQLVQSNGLNKQNVFKILSQSPNKNKLTLISAVLDTKNAQIYAEVWQQ